MANDNKEGMIGEIYREAWVHGAIRGKGYARVDCDPSLAVVPMELPMIVLSRENP